MSLGQTARRILSNTADPLDEMDFPRRAAIPFAQIECREKIILFGKALLGGVLCTHSEIMDPRTPFSRYRFLMLLLGLANLGTLIHCVANTIIHPLLSDEDTLPSSMFLTMPISAMLITSLLLLHAVCCGHSRERGERMLRMVLAVFYLPIGPIIECVDGISLQLIEHGRVDLHTLAIFMESGAIGSLAIMAWNWFWLTCPNFSNEINRMFAMARDFDAPPHFNTALALAPIAPLPIVIDNPLRRHAANLEIHGELGEPSSEVPEAMARI